MTCYIPNDNRYEEKVAGFSWNIAECVHQDLLVARLDCTKHLTSPGTFRFRSSLPWLLQIEREQRGYDFVVLCSVRVPIYTYHILQMGSWCNVLVQGFKYMLAYRPVSHLI